MSNEKEIFEIEKVVRSIPIRSEMLYKPNIFSCLGIYRKNKYQLRPTIYVSNKEKNEADFVVNCVIDNAWTYRKIKQELNNNR